jgi:hypothetical protein
MFAGNSLDFYIEPETSYRYDLSGFLLPKILYLQVKLHSGENPME